MIELTTGNLLKADAEALVNTVNCVGVMGKGIALQFKQAFPENYRAYAKACKDKEVQLGSVYIFSSGRLLNPKYIVNFPTKGHWRAKSRLDDIETGLSDLVKRVKELGIKSIAIPPLGSGLGGLKWEDVRPRIEAAFSEIPEVKLLLYTPKGSPAANKMPIGTKRPNMTKGRALLIRLLEIYGSMGYRHSLLEVQKLMYFMQQSGEALRLKFTPHKFGPYAENLHHVLQRIDGHFIRGYGDRSSKAQIYLLPGAVEAAISTLKKEREAEQHLETVERLIQGFETPYGMELLSTVHWVALALPEPARNIDNVVVKVQQWSKRKEYLFKPNHIRKAWQRLLSEHWLQPSSGHV